MGNERGDGSTARTVAVVVPTYREAENLPELAERVRAALTNWSGCYEVIVVDDDSRDGTDKVVEGLAADGHPVRLITRRGERGLSSAVIRGFQESRADLLVCMDADLSHPPEALPELLAELNQPGTDMAVGSRYVPGASTDQDWGLFRRLNSTVATFLARPFTSIRDPMSGFFALPRQVFERAESLNPIGYKIALELLVKCRCRGVREIPIHFADRKRGQSKLSLKEQLKYVCHLGRLAAFKLRKGMARLLGRGS